MALPTVVPNVEVDNEGLCSTWRYFGPWDALLVAGLTPQGYKTPPDCNRRGGFRWRDSEGRGWTMSDSGNGYKVTAYLKKSEIEQKNREVLHSKRILEVDKCINRLSVAKDLHYRTRALELLNSSFVLLEGEMFRRHYLDGRATHNQGTHAYAASHQETFAEAYRKVRAIITDGDLDIDTTQLEIAKRVKASLEDRAFQGVLAKISN